MKTDMLQVLAYLLEHYLTGNVRANLNQEQLVTELRQAGFRINMIYHAFEWLTDLFDLQRNEHHLASPGILSFRLYHSHENVRLDENCRGYLLSLEHLHILNPTMREQVINRLLCLRVSRLTIDDIKMVTIIVLSAHADQKPALLAMKKLMLEESSINSVH